MLQILKQNHRIISVLLLVLCISVAEMVLIEAKYDFFTGGFLLPHVLKDNFNRLNFLTISLWVDFLFYGGIAFLFGWVCTKCKCRALLTTYHFFFLTGTVCLLIIAIKYKLLSYFSDTVNYQVLKNLGGGSITDALLYVSNESMLYIWLFGALMGCYVAGHVFLRKFLVSERGSKYNNEVCNIKLRISYPYILFFILLTVSVFHHSYADDVVRYGVSKKISYTVFSKLLSKLTDFDNDGAGYVAFPSDSAPFDSSIYPGALDIPDNGIDEDGYGGDFIYKKPSSQDTAAFRIMPAPDRKHLILIVLESARADLLDKKIEGKYVAPNVRNLAEQGISYEYAYSHTGYTTSSLNTLFTGRLLGLPRGTSLFEVLHNSGYQISVFSGQDESFGDVSEVTGMKKYSATFFDARTGIEDRVFPSKSSGSLRLDERRVLAEIGNKIKQADWEQPQFMYINFQAGHFPYNHPGMPQFFDDIPIPRDLINEDNRKWVENTYWNALAYADWAVGKVTGMLQAAGVYHNCVVIVTGDHGESLFDDGFLGHGHAANKIQTHVPLVVNNRHRKVTEPVGQTDLFSLMLQSISREDVNVVDIGNNEKAVFQFVGNINQPAVIGMVQKDELRTLLDLRTGEIFFSDLGKWIRYKQVKKMDADSQLLERTNQLIYEWERLRWELHSTVKN